MLCELIVNHPAIPQDEQEALLTSGIKAERDSVLLGYAKYVWKSVHKLKNPEDAFQEVFIGFCTAANKYDPSKGKLFCTYATWWIKAAVKQHRLKNNTVMRLPFEMLQLVQKYRAAENFVTVSLNDKPTFDDICDYMDLSDKNKGLLEDALSSTTNSIPPTFDKPTSSLPPYHYKEKEEEIKKKFAQAVDFCNKHFNEEERNIIWFKEMESLSRQEVADALNLTMKELTEKERKIRVVLQG